jgi:hypothetical protein
VAYKALREIRKDLPRFCGRRIALSVSPPVAEMLLGPARKALAQLGQELGREIEVRAVPGQHQEQFEIAALDHGAPVSLALPWLSARPDAEEADEADFPAGDLDEPELLTGAAPELSASAPEPLAPVVEILDAEEEKPILPRSDEIEGS